MKSGGITDSRRLTPEERDRLLSALGAEGDRIMLRLLLEAGCPGAGGALRLGRGGRRDLRGRSGEVAEGGTAGPLGAVFDPAFEEVPLSPELLEAITDYGEKNPGKKYIFEGRCGKPVGPKGVRCAIEPAAERLGLGELFPRRGRRSARRDGGVSRIFAISPGR